jgi:hypothetical protein
MNSSSAPPWLIRPYAPGDETALVGLFARVFGRAITAEHWRWKLKTLPAPVENVWLAVHEDKPIFQYAGIPTRYRLNNRDLTAMVSVDTMTAPEFQRRGLLSAVGQHTYSVWRAAGIPFVIGLPNERWGSRANALGWQTLFPLQWLTRPLRPEQTLARKTRLPFLTRFSFLSDLWNTFTSPRLITSLTVRAVEHAGAEFDMLWQMCASLISVIRDRAWVQWRYLDAPTFNYRVLLAERGPHPVGYLAYRLDPPTGLIADLFAPDRATRHTLLAHALRMMRVANIETVATLAMPHTPLHYDLRRAGFFPRLHAFTVQLVPLAADLPLDLLRNPHHWILAGGDFDVI